MVGGAPAAGVIRQCQKLGYAGELWAVHPTRSEVAGVAAYASVEALPGVPDAAFVGVPAEQAIEVVAGLSARGCGGAVVYASGFAEAGGVGLERQVALVAAAGEMPVIGPNCMGVIDYRLGAALWPDQQGAPALDGHGVAIVTQSGNIALNLTMQQRGLPIAAVLAVGNCAVTGVVEVLDAYVERPEITAIGLHLEQVPPLAELLPVARRAAAAGKPVVVLRTGRSSAGARASATHTAALAGDDAIAAAVLEHCGFAEAEDVSGFLETLLLAHVGGEISEASIVSASCSGGEAALIADLAAAAGVAVPELSDADRARLGSVLGQRVPVHNPLDYHTYVWGDPIATRALFDAVMQVEVGLRVLVLDEPVGERCDPTDWEITLAAWVAAAKTAQQPAAVLSTMSELMPADTARRLAAAGVAPLRGMRDALAAVRSLNSARAQRCRLLEKASWVPSTDADARLRPRPRSRPRPSEGIAWLADAGIATPGRVTVLFAQAAEAAAGLRPPWAVKTAAPILHKSDVGGVRVGLSEPAEVEVAARAMANLGEHVVIEEMVTGAVCELLLSARRDPAHGVTLTLGAGGIHTELLSDTTVLVGAITPQDVDLALRRLRCWPLLEGFRGAPAADVGAVVEAALALVAGLARDPEIAEVEVNPLIVLPRGQGVCAVDALLLPLTGSDHG